MSFKPGTRVSHPTHGFGTVVDRTAHTLPDHERVEFTAQTFVQGKPPRQVRLRVRRNLLQVIGSVPVKPSVEYPPVTKEALDRKARSLFP
jgi:hypothetical protein